jgi:diphthine-ammonia ligase
MSLEEPVLFIISIQASSSSSRHMHVESISSWAPANIGPYSQSQLYAGDGLDSSALLLVSGQIALIPERMELAVAEGRPQQQLEVECAQVSRNLAAVVAANGVAECVHPAGRPLARTAPCESQLEFVSRDAVCAGSRRAQLLLLCLPLETLAPFPLLSFVFRSTLL